MARSKIEADDLGKTGALLGIGHMLLTPFWYVDSKLGASAAVLATVAFLYNAHEIGKKQRPVGNVSNNINSWFRGTTGDKSTEIENAVTNIAVGGGALFDELTILVKPK